MALTAETESRTTGSLIRVRHMRFSYAYGPEILSGVDLDVQRGQIQVVLGRSGSGKSTLLKIFAGLLRAEASYERQSGLKTSYIPQSLGLVRSQTALQNTLTGALGRISAWRSLAGFPAPIVNEAQDILRRLGLQDKIDTPVSKLSGGQRQRVAIARALMAKPDLMLADEFVSQLDEVTAEEVLSLIRTIADSGVAFLMTAHHLDLAHDQADRVLVLKSGRVALDVEAARFAPEQAKELLI